MVMKKLPEGVTIIDEVVVIDGTKVHATALTPVFIKKLMKLKNKVMLADTPSLDMGNALWFREFTLADKRKVKCYSVGDADYGVQIPKEPKEWSYHEIYRRDPKDLDAAIESFISYVREEYPVKGMHYDIHNY